MICSNIYLVFVYVNFHQNQSLTKENTLYIGVLLTLEKPLCRLLFWFHFILVAFLLITFNLSTLKVSCSEEFSSFNNTPKAISFSIQNVAWQLNSLIKYFFFFYSQFFVTKYRFFPLHASSVNHQGRYILFVYYFLTFTYKKGGHWPHWETAMIFV